jgi:hypothetical protein
VTCEFITSHFSARRCGGPPTHLVLDEHDARWRLVCAAHAATCRDDGCRTRALDDTTEWTDDRS